MTTPEEPAAPATPSPHAIPCLAGSQCFWCTEGLEYGNVKALQEWYTYTGLPRLRSRPQHFHESYLIGMNQNIQEMLSELRLDPDGTFQYITDLQVKPPPPPPPPDAAAAASASAPCRGDVHDPDDKKSLCDELAADTADKSSKASKQTWKKSQAWKASWVASYSQSAWLDFVQQHPMHPLSADPTRGSVVQYWGGRKLKWKNMTAENSEKVLRVLTTPRRCESVELTRDGSDEKFSCTIWWCHGKDGVMYDTREKIYRWLQVWEFEKPKPPRGPAPCIIDPTGDSWDYADGPKPAWKTDNGTYGAWWGDDNHW